MAPLRRIAVTIDRPGAGRFRWRLIEQASQDSDWADLQQAGKSFGTYHAAMAAGLVALEALIDDLAKGPIGDPEVEAAPAPRERKEAQSKSAGASKASQHETSDDDRAGDDEEEQQAPAKPAGAFGFGGLG